MALKSALYVDFDNVFGSLSRQNATAEKVFAGYPHKWVAWLEAGGDGGEPRDILVRRVYLNPKDFGNFRFRFTNAGFQTVDCPSFTRHGKNSADIQMVMDIMDALNHPTRFDEFIILSADSDFTPVLLRLREHGRLTTVYSTEMTAAPLKGAASRELHDYEFIEKALGVKDPHRAAREEAAEALAEARTVDDPAEELAFVAGAVVEEVAGARGPVPLAELPHIIRAAYPPFLGSNWLGYHSLRGLVDAIVSVRADLALGTEGMDGWLELVAPGNGNGGGNGSGNGSGTPPPEPVDDDTLREQVLDHIAGELAKSSVPLHGAVLGLNIPKLFGPRVRDSNWFGAGSLTQLIRGSGRSGMATSAYVIFDPGRHTLPEEGRGPSSSALADLPDDLAEFIEDAASFGWPRIGPAQIDQVIREAVALIGQGVTAAPELSVKVRDALRDAVDRGELPPDRFVSRANVNLLLNSLVKAEVDLAGQCTTEDDLRRQLYQSLLDLVAYNMSVAIEDATPMADRLMGYAAEDRAAEDRAAEDRAAEDRAAGDRADADGAEPPAPASPGEAPEPGEDPLVLYPPEPAQAPQGPADDPPAETPPALPAVSAAGTEPAPAPEPPAAPSTPAPFQDLRPSEEQDGPRPQPRARPWWARRE